MSYEPGSHDDCMLESAESEIPMCNVIRISLQPGRAATLVALRGLWRHTDGARGGEDLAGIVGQRGGIGQIRPVPYVFRGEDHHFGSAARKSAARP